MKTILFIPGYVCDVFSTLEKYAIELTKTLSDEYNIIWLVPSINNPDNRFKDKNNKNKLEEPVYVTEAKKHNIKIITADLSKFNLLKNLLILNKIFKENKVEAVYTEFGFERYVAAVCSKLLGQKTIFRAQGHLGSKYKFLKDFIHIFFIDFFLPVSYYVAGFIPKSKKYYVIHNTNEIKTYKKPAIDEIKQIKYELGLDNFEQIVIMVSAFRDVKRHNIAIDIIEKIKNRTNQNIGFVFLGAGGLYDYYKEEIKKKKFDDIIFMPGHTTEVEKYLKISDISILTSLEEGLPVSLLESMNYKMPLVAFNTGWARELITNGINGYLIDIDDKDKFADAVLELVNDQSVQEEFGENSYKILNQNYSMDLWKEKMKETFNKILVQ